MPRRKQISGGFPETAEKGCAGHLLTGGQHIGQLARLTASDYDRDTRTITLRDPKGRRSEPRLHVIPLIPEAVDALHAMRPENFGPYQDWEQGRREPSGAARTLLKVAALRPDAVHEALNG